MQGLTRNPLADPGILGVNAGASFAMVLAISAFGITDLHAYVWWAFAGAAAAMVLVHAVASMGRDGATPVKVAIAGAALTAAVSSWTSGVLLTDRQTMESFRCGRWARSAVGRSDVLLVGLPFLLVGAVLGTGVRPQPERPGPRRRPGPRAGASRRLSTGWWSGWRWSCWPAPRPRSPGRSRSSA